MNDTIPPDEPLPTQIGNDGETVDAPPVEAVFVPGTEVGGRYRIYSRLGAGGMGEVWHAFDLKLRVDVALKALRPDLLASRKRRELLRQEVRAAREVVSPNVCRIFDLIEVDGRELVSMEYVDGRTLLDELRTRGPLELEEARDIAAQFLAGLEAIHNVGLVHRDIKPENIMLTRTGRVVVMDFGLARQESEGGGSVSGTPAYMAPEQAAGQTVDARADVYSAGVVLAEMVSPDGIKNLDSRKSLWEGVRSEPPTLPDSPWAPVIKTAVARDREHRYHSAHTLTRALEEVAQRVAGADDVTPYPGLASFTEADAEFFFGREAEVEQLWRLLNGPPRLLGIMGPSGAGKTSFIRAGVTPTAPSDWSVIRCTPGNAAIASLRGALASGLPSGSDALRQLVTDPDDQTVIVRAVSRWREDHAGAVIFVDQFEELFTLNSEDEQRRLAALLGRLPIETNVHVVLSMRDDFAASCNRHEALRPIFHELSMLDPPAGANLRRALVQPAAKCGYRFEDDDLVDEILAEVEDERGALPLLAFALARLWEQRDREAGLLTRQAYHDIRGVGGALARHAEATVDSIGVERIPIVRELFRNLVTAEGTRAVREWDELLSVFDRSALPAVARQKVRRSALPTVASKTLGVRRLTSHSERSERSPLTPYSERSERSLSHSSPARDAAEEVLRELVDARLLTSYEVREDEHDPVRRVEIIHESLLANWPRLVRWQTQDADAVQVREQLRQAAKTWNEHGRSDDTLWTGATYREFASWRERYPGGLTELEEEFARAMTAHARRRTRRRRLAVAAALLVAAVTAAVFAGLWQRSEQQTRRAEGARLLAMARLELERDATKALAWATASLELADTPEARRFAVETLWRGPTRFEVKPVEGLPRPENIAFSPDGTYLAANSFASNELLVWSEDGGGPLVLGEVGETRYLGDVIFSTMPTGETVLVQTVAAMRNLWSVPGLELLHQFDTERWDSGEIVAGRFIGWSSDDPQRLLHLCPLDGGEPTTQKRWPRLGATQLSFDASGESVLFTRGNEVVRRPIDDLETEQHDEVVARHPADIVRFEFGAPGSPITTLDNDGLVRLWSGESDPERPLAVLRGPGRRFWTDPSGTLLGSDSEEERTLRLWDTTAPPDAAPMVIPIPEGGNWGTRRKYGVHPQRRWLVGQGGGTLFFWPLGRPYPRVLEGDPSRVTGLTFLGDGGRLASATEGSIRLWPLSSASGELAHELIEGSRNLNNVAASPSGDTLLIARYFYTGVHRMELATGSMELVWPPQTGVVWPALAFSPDGRQAAAAASYAFEPEHMVMRVWDTTLWSERVFDLVDTDWSGAYNGGYLGGVGDLQFTPDGGLLTAGSGGIRHWDLATGEAEWLVRTVDDRWMHMSSDRSGRHLLTSETVAAPHADSVFEALALHDRETGSSRPITTHGEHFYSAVLDPTGTIVVTSVPGEGLIQVGGADGSEPHLLYGHTSNVMAIAISPDSRWIATGDEFGEIRLWRMPDVNKPPLHTLPHDELLATLKSLTNLRVVRDEDAATGWNLTHDPFPGWETVPTW